MKKAAKTGVEVEGSDDETPLHFDGTTTMHAAAPGSSKEKQKPLLIEGDEDEVPVLISNEWPNLQTLLDDADIVVEILDARDPLAGRSEHLEGRVREKKGQKLLLVLNKIGMSSRLPCCIAYRLTVYV